ncbi:hypothetical protein DCPSUM001_34110 [Dysgonomonas capnocytophagoides]|nr:hypothetical protein DCPSUM001_34110 [Dysgonomonas capnocytophagoides]
MKYVIIIFSDTYIYLVEICKFEPTDIYKSDQTFCVPTSNTKREHTLTLFTNTDNIRIIPLFILKNDPKK